MDLPSFTSEIENVILMDEIPIIPIAEGYTRVRHPHVVTLGSRSESNGSIKMGMLKSFSTIF